MSDLLQLAEVVLAEHGPIMVECKWCSGRGGFPEDGRLFPCSKCSAGRPVISLADTAATNARGTRPLTPAELATPDGDRPNAHLWRLLGKFDWETAFKRGHGHGIVLWRFEAIVGKSFSQPTATHATLAALAAAAGEVGDE